MLGKYRFKVVKVEWAKGPTDYCVYSRRWWSLWYHERTFGSETEAAKYIDKQRPPVDETVIYVSEWMK